MYFIQEGSIATGNIENIKSLPMASLNITSTEAYDLKAIFQKLSTALDKFEMKETGSRQDLDSLKNELDLLPIFYEERLECDLRVQLLEKKWGLIEKSIAGGRAQIIFPIKLEDVDNVLIEKSHASYINLGKDGRFWVNAYLKTKEATSFHSEEQLFSITDSAIQVLYTIICEIKNASTESAWLNSLAQLNIQVNSSHISELFDTWMNLDKNNIQMVGQIKKWIVSHTEAISEKQKIASTVDGVLLSKITESKTSG